MESVYVKLPLWKVYLYSLQQRIRLYKAINSNRYRWKLSRAEVSLLRQTLKKYVPREVIRKPKAYGYQYLLQSVLIDNVTVATQAEIELIQKLLIVNKLNLEELIMEMKDLKKFAKEVGIKDADIKGMDEDTLIRTLITKVEPQKTYSKELVEFYNDLNDHYFDEAEATEQTTVAESNSKGNGYPIEEVIEGIKEFTKVTELKEILADDDIGSLFDGFDPAPYKLAPKLKKAMIDFLKNPPAVEEPITENENAEIIEAVLELVEEEDLVSAFEELQESHFSEIDVESVEDEIQLKAAMLAALGYGVEKEVEVKELSFAEKLKAKKEAAAGSKTKLTAKTDDEFDWFDPAGDIEEQYAKVEELGFAKAKSFAKHKLGLTLKVGLKKDEIFDAIATKMQEMVESGVTESTEEGEIELTPELVADAVKAKDKETLVAMCDQMGIKLNAIQKKGISGMEKKLLEKLGETKTKVTPKGKQTKLKLGTKKEKVSEEKSVYQLMEELVIAGKSEDAITKAVSPYYKEKGKSILFIKKRVKTMIGIIKIDNDIE